jgi:2-dehydro-3-deoxygluconokinase
MSKVTQNKLRILCFGEAMVELSAIDFFKKNAKIGVAGDTLNTAIYLKRLLGPNADVDYLTVLGQDYFSNQVKKYIEAEGIGSRAIRQTKSRTVGLYAINTDCNGERTFSYWREASAARLLFQLDEDFMKLMKYDLIYFSGISLAILPEGIRDKLFDFLEKRSPRLKVAFDSNYRPNLWESKEKAQKSIKRAFMCSDVALPSLEDELDLLELKTDAEVRDWFSNTNITQTVLKRGPSGPQLIGKVTHDCKFSSLQTVTDSTAAGDSFNAGFLASYLTGCSVLDSAHHGHELAKVVVSHSGAICPKDRVKSIKWKQ